MKISVVAVGKIKEPYLADAVAEYSKRISRYARLDIISVPEEAISETDSLARRAELRETEAERMLAKVRPSSTVIACDLAGREMTSEQFAAMLAAHGLAGRSDIAFLIGGPTGFAPRALERADDRVCFSQMTFPHQLMRVILLEQIYRAFKIQRNEPYHL
ncbi:MAG: Ribosomal RNA large subunit methyltransferase H [Firmicutes bacterium ADurb.Bin506]|jgi:23S rRNA (pseudouridine1915-N3)-methyltransferase|nr:MAG: Ribosomal RNA large subunit methyltransferase H [Firmicutes bacterium ADurb.Bin506]